MTLRDVPRMAFPAVLLAGLLFACRGLLTPTTAVGQSLPVFQVGKTYAVAGLSTNTWKVTSLRSMVIGSK